MPITGAIPQNQLNALPLQTVAQATAPDSVTIGGNKLTKYFGPTALGISAVNFAVDPDLATATVLFSNYVDVTGMNEFVALLVATIPNAGAVANQNINLRIQYRNPGGTVQPRSGVFGQNNFTSAGNRTPNFGILGTPTTYIVAFNWANSQGVVTVGADCRLWFSKDTIAVPVPGQLWDCHLWACQS